MTIRLIFVFGIFLFSCVGRGGESVPKLSPEAEQALRKLNLPGIKLNLEERCVDVNATVCLHKGLLELVACTKGSKEHESILSIAARPMHIHTAMLLMGARPGTPAMRKARTGRSSAGFPLSLQEILFAYRLCFLIRRVSHRSIPSASSFHLPNPMRSAVSP